MCIADVGLLRSFIVNRHKSEKSRIAKFNYIKKILTECNPLTESNFEIFLAKKRTEKSSDKEGNSAACINKYIQAVRTYADYHAKYYDPHLYDWVNALKQEKEDPRPKEILNTEELKAFLALGPHDKQSQETYMKWQLFWAMAAWTGRRLGEIRTLTVTQVDFGNYRIILPKTKTKAGDAPLVDVLHSPLQTHIAGLKGKYLFASQWDPNTPMSDKAYEKDFRKRLEVLGIKRYIKPYALRDTAIVRWLRSLKIPLYDAMRLAGHTKPSTTMKYYQLADLEDLRQELNSDPALQDEMPPERVVEDIEKFVYEKLKKDRRFNPSTVRQAMSILWESFRSDFSPALNPYSSK